MMDRFDRLLGLRLRKRSRVHEHTQNPLGVMQSTYRQEADAHSRNEGDDAQITYADIGLIEYAAVNHGDLTPELLAALRDFFESEYGDELGSWDPDQPFGYAPHEVHVLALDGPTVVGHVGWARRRITVGDAEVTIAGVGGVLVSPAARKAHIGRQLMDAAVETMRSRGDIEFGYLGCAESVARFYASCGWTCISASERWINRDGKTCDGAPGAPLFIYPINRATGTWPDGPINLRGRAW